MIKRIFVYSFIGLAGCNQVSESSDGFFLDCEGTKTFEAKTDTLVEPYREIFFVNEDEKEVLKSDEFGVPLCGTGEVFLSTSFGDDEISCRKQFEYGKMMSIEAVTINRVSGHLSIVDQQFAGDEGSGFVTTQATCSKSQTRPDNKL